MVQKPNIQMVFLYLNRACFCFENWQKNILKSTILSTLDYGDFMYAHAAATTLTPQDAAD